MTAGLLRKVRVATITVLIALPYAILLGVVRNNATEDVVDVPDDPILTLINQYPDEHSVENDAALTENELLGK